jgi:hypothetical protein
MASTLRCFKEGASLINFLFYGFLIKGLGAEISSAKDCRKFGGCQRFVIRQRFDHFEHGGPVRQAGTEQYGRECAHKSWAQGDLTSLGDYMNANQHFSMEEYETISGA